MKNVKFTLGSVPKEALDAALLAEVEALRKENASLKKKMERLHNDNTYTDNQRKSITELYRDIKAILEKHSYDFDLHEECH